MKAVPRESGVRGALVAAAAVVAASALVACNDANAFADEYAAYLETQPSVETFRVRPNNTMPGAESVDSTITLRDGMSDDDVTATIQRLAAHQVDERIDEHRLRVTFSARDGEAAVTLLVIPGSDNPRMGDRSTLRHWVQRTRAATVETPTIVALRLWSDAVDATTAASAFPVATAIDAFVESEPAGLVQLSVSGADCNLQWDADDSPTALAAYRDLIALLPNGVAPAHCRASSQRPLTEASFFITVPRDTAPAIVQAMRERAADLGVPAEITVAA